MTQYQHVWEATYASAFAAVFADYTAELQHAPEENDYDEMAIVASNAADQAASRVKESWDKAGGISANS